MASDAGISTNTLLVVAALGVVAVVMWQRRGGYGAPRAAAADARPGGMGGIGGSGFTAADVKTLTEAAIGLGEGIRRWSTDENEDAALASANEIYVGTPCKTSNECGFGEKCPQGGGVCMPE